MIRAETTSLRAAIAVLWLLLLVNLAGASWRVYQLAARVRADALVEFFWEFVLYPGVLAILDSVALWWLYTGKPAGRNLAAIIFVYQGIQTARLAWSGGGPDIVTPLERGMAYLTQGGLAAGLLLLGVWVLLRGTTSETENRV